MLVESRNALRGEITVPGDKSISQRAIVTGALAKGTTEIDNFLLNEDCISTIECFRKMQIGIEILQNNRVRIQGKGLYGLKAPTISLNTGRSGTAIRLLMGVLCGQPFTSTIIRNEAVMKKPVGNLVGYLREMGANISGRDDGNVCPLMISQSRLKGTDFTLPVTDSSIKASLLYAGLYADGNTTVSQAVVTRDHTELMLNYFGADVNTDHTKVITHPIENLYAQHVEVPGDISMAAYFITAAMLVPKSDIVIKNVGVNPTRSVILDVYKAMGADIELLNQKAVSNEQVADIHVRYAPLTSTNIGPELIPCLIDELPIIITACAFAKGTTEITGLAGFKIKESGKIKALALELSKMGAKLTETEDSLVIEGKDSLRGTIVESNNNHSLAMALSVAGLAAQGETMIRKTQAVDIVYPAFYTTLNKL